jgi:hypothetical protein
MSSFSRQFLHPGTMLLSVAGVAALLIGERALGAFLLLLSAFHAGVGMARFQAGHAVARYHQLSLHGLWDLIWTTALIITLVYLNVHWVFERGHIEAAFVTYGDPDSRQAVTLGLTLITLCLITVFVQKRSGGSMFAPEQFRGHTLFSVIVLTLFTLLNVIYNPWIAPWFETAALSMQDWLYVGGAWLAFTLVREFTIRNRKYSRRAVLALHQAKHPKQ